MSKRFLKHCSIKTVVITAVVLLLTVSIVVASSFLHSFRVQNGLSKKELYISNIENVTAGIETKIKAIIEVQQELSLLDITRSFTESGFQTDGNEVIKEYREALLAARGVSEVILVRNGGECFNCVGGGNYNSYILEKIDSFAPFGIIEGQESVYVLTRAIYSVDYEEKIGKIVFIIEPSAFLSAIQMSQFVDDARYLVAYNSNPITPLSAKGYIKDLPDNWMYNTYNMPELQFNYFKASDTGYCATHTFSEKYGLITYMMVPRSSITGGWPKNTVLYLVLCSFAVLISIALICWLFYSVKRSSQKVKLMLEKIGDSDAEAGDFSVPVTEFFDVAQSIDEMLDTFKSLSNKNLLAEKELLEKELANRKATMSALKNQINPHFIYNTLSCVKNMGMQYDESHIPEICDAIIQILRYSIKEATTATVSEEMEALESYMFIQSCRFEGKFAYKISVDESIKECQMLRFLLQPILENAIIHGISPQKIAGKVIVSGRLKDKNIVFDISDTGVGMSAEALNVIKKRLEVGVALQDDDRGIGLANINGRLKLFYGEDCFMKINSVPDMGTFITISFPKLEVE